MTDKRNCGGCNNRCKRGNSCMLGMCSYADNPRLCRAKGSPGPDCCKKKCVNVKTDKQNCGLCGKKCKHQEICCNGKCVNLMTDKRNCGGCNNRCKRANSCMSGMCSYA
ncbi:putative stigma-specific protein Stig1 [Helianthus annuus]|nr:putative stigma-specific protein Stig1 [Helianthus annuus]